MRLAGSTLQVKSIAESLAFYRERIGMQVLAEASLPGDGAEEMRITLGFEPHGPQAALELVHHTDRADDPTIRYRPTPSDRYWKIGVTLPQVDIARDRLLEAGIAVSDATQFRDIGYLCHLADPDGYVIELLQHRFEINHVPSPPDRDFVLGSRPTLGQVSLRVRDADASLAFYRDRLGLKLLSRQSVDPPGFTLYFLADTEESPPDTDPDAPSNREWLWQRPYTTLELQHRWAADKTPPSETRDGELGFVELCFEHGHERSGRRDGAARTMEDPDGNRVRIVGDG